jgi:hypothetical protein
MNIQITNYREGSGVYPNYDHVKIGCFCVGERRDGMWEVVQRLPTHLVSGVGVRIFCVETSLTKAYIKALWYRMTADRIMLQS